MSQLANYVVRQDAGGELKLLLIRDPRAEHAASKISPTKRSQSTTPSSSSPSSSLSTALSSSASASSSAPSSSSFASTASTAPSSSLSTSPSSLISAITTSIASLSSLATKPGASNPKLKKVSSGPVMSSGTGAISPTSLTMAAKEALALASIVKLTQKKTETPQDGQSRKGGGGGGGGGGRVKGGRIVKLQTFHQNKPSSSMVSKTAALSTASSSSSSSQGTTKSVISKATTSSSSNAHVPRPSVKPVSTRHKNQALLPVSRIKTIMRTNVQSTHSTHNVSQDSVVMATKATELFIAQLAREAHKVTVGEAKREVSYNHLAAAVRRAHQMEFLHDVIPEKVLVKDYLASLGKQDHTPNHTPSSPTTSH